MGQQDYETETLIAHSLRGEGFDASEDRTGRGTPLVPVAFQTRGSNLYVGDEAGTLGQNAGSASGCAPCIAFTSKDHGADAGDISPTLRSMGHDGSHANGGGQMAVAFDMRGREGGAQFEGPHDTANMRAASGGSSRSYVAASAVRRLTPRECERLQGFSDILRTVRVLVCEDENSASAPSAQRSSAPLSHVQNAPAVVRVLIDLERQHLQLLRADGLSWSASGVERPNSSPLSMPADAFVRLAAHTIISLVQATPDGSAASPVPTQPSIHRWSGSAFAKVSGREIAELANDADRFTSEANRLSRFTTSPLGRDTQTDEQTLRTWSCCVLAAISGFIPAETRSAPSYIVEVAIKAGFTLVPHRGKPAADGPRYKALGNSMAVPVVAWIGRRIAAVDAMQVQRLAA